MEINYNQNLESANIIISPQLGKVKMGHKSISISPVNMKVMMVLIKNQGQVVSRNQLFDSVWKNQVVSDDTLTRCISDLRAQVGKDQIKTLPKRGYQWIPIVKQSTSNKIFNKTFIQKMKMMQWLAFALLGMFLISVTTLWVANKIIKPNQVRIALLPIKVKSGQYSELANHTEGILQAAVINSKKLKLLSSSVLIGHNEKPFPYLSREYGAQWIIEGQISNYQNKPKITLSLVDARTALVVYSFTNNTNAQETELADFCDQFLQKLLLF